MKTVQTGSNSSGEWVIDALMHVSSSFLNLVPPTKHQMFCHGVDATITLDQVEKTLLITTPKAKILLKNDGTIHIEAHDVLVSSLSETIVPGADANG